MGAAEFTTSIWMNADLRTAYDAVCTDAVSVHGRDPYNGTISTTTGVTRVLNPQVMTAKGAALAAGWMIDGRAGDDYRAHKWEEAKAVAIMSDDAFTFRTTTLRFNLDDLREYISSLPTSDDSEWVRETAERLLTTHPDAHMWEFVPAMVLRTVPVHTVHAVTSTIVPRFKLVTTRSEGKAVTRFEVVGGNGTVVHTADTRARANTFVHNTLNSENPRFTELGIRAVKASPDMPNGADSVTSRQVVSAAITVKVTTATPRAKAPANTRKGWVFYGMASI